MAQFTLTWDNTAVLASMNAIGQRANYRRKDVGGVWITAGFTPANDLSTAVITVDSPNSLLENVVYEFKIQTLCTTGGPTDNSNGIIEQIIFGCIEPDVTQSDVASTIDVNVTGTNITKVKFTLRKTSDDSIISGPTTVIVVADHATKTASGLTPETDYYWEVELIAVIDGSEVVSSAAEYLNTVCGPYSFTTEEEAECPAAEDLVVTQPAP